MDQEHGKRGPEDGTRDGAGDIGRRQFGSDGLLPGDGADCSAAGQKFYREPGGAVIKYTDLWAKFPVEVGIPERESEIRMGEQKGEGSADSGHEIPKDTQSGSAEEKGPQQWCAEQSLRIGIERLQGIQLGRVEATANIGSGRGTGASGDQQSGENGDEKTEQRKSGGMQQIFGDQWF